MSLARSDSDGARGGGDLSAGGHRADSGGGVGGQLLGLVVNGVRSRRDDDVRSTADLLLKGDVGLVVGLLAALADLAGHILGVQVAADAGVVAGAALAVGDGREDVGLDRLGKLLNSTNDVLVALLGDRGSGVVLSSDV